MLRRRTRTHVFLDRFGRSRGEVRVGQAFEGSLTADVAWDSHAQIEAWLAERLFTITRDCSNAEARALAQSREDNRACWGLVDPILIGSCWLNNGTRYRNTIAAIQSYCEQLRKDARAYAADAHARLDARLAAEAEAERLRQIRNAARTPIRDARPLLRSSPFVPVTAALRGGFVR